MKHTTLGWRTLLALGVIGSVLTAACGSIDVINNYLYAASPIGKAAMVVAGLMLMAVPGMAAIHGWLKHYVLITVVALAMTATAGLSSYSTGQQQTALVSQTVQENYKKAEAKRTRALEVLSSIKVTGTAKELGKLTDKADKAETEAGKKLAEAETASAKVCKRPHSEACSTAKTEAAKAADARKRAEADATLAHERLSQAEARDKAEADLAEAEAASAKGGAVVREENQLLNWLCLLLTLSGAMLGEKGVALITAGWQARQARAAKPARKDKAAAAATAKPDAAEPDLLARIKALVRAQPDRVLRMSIRELADELGVKRAGLHGRLGKYRNDGALDVKVEGKGRASATVISLPAKKKAA